jgi:hypothetical protein
MPLLVAAPAPASMRFETGKLRAPSEVFKTLDGLTDLFLAKVSLLDGLSMQTVVFPTLAPLLSLLNQSHHIRYTNHSSGSGAAASTTTMKTT